MRIAVHLNITKQNLGAGRLPAPPAHSSLLRHVSKVRLMGHKCNYVNSLCNMRHASQSENPTLSIDFALRETASLSFLTYNKKKTMSKSCCVTRCTENKLKTQNYDFISRRPKKYEHLRTQQYSENCANRRQETLIIINHVKGLFHHPCEPERRYIE